MYCCDLYHANFIFKYRLWNNKKNTVCINSLCQKKSEWSEKTHYSIEILKNVLNSQAVLLLISINYDSPL